MTKRTDTPPLPTRPELLDLVEASPTPLWIAEPSGGRRYFNPAWYSVTGREPSSELGWGWLDGVHPEDRERVERTIKDAVRSGHRYGTLYRLACRHDEWRKFEEHGYPRSQAGQLVSWIGTCRDTTQQQLELQRYRELARLTEQVAEAANRRAALDTILHAFESSERKGAVFTVDSDGNPQLEAALSVFELSIEASSKHIREAIRTGRAVIASNLETEPEPWGFSLPNNESPLLALWALPAHEPTHGAFVVFFTTASLPSDTQVEDLSPWTSLVSLALQVKERNLEETDD